MKIDIDTIEKYILGGEWENQYPRVIKELIAEVKSLREMYEEASRDLHIMIGAFGIELLVETRLGEQE